MNCIVVRALVFFSHSINYESFLKNNFECKKSLISEINFDAIQSLCCHRVSHHISFLPFRKGTVLLVLAFPVAATESSYRNNMGRHMYQM